MAGYITGFLHTIFQIPAILAGILTQISLYSINLRMMGRSNMPLLKEKSVFDVFETFFVETLHLNMNKVNVTIIVGSLCSILVIVFLYWFFGTEIGCAIRATGNNEYMVRALGQNTNRTKVFALMLSNGLIALSGALVAMYEGSGDVAKGTGASVIGLASIVIGEVLLGKLKSFGGKLFAIVIGAIIYRMIIALVLHFGLVPGDLKILTAIIVALEQLKDRFHKKKSRGYLYVKN